MLKIEFCYPLKILKNFKNIFFLFFNYGNDVITQKLHNRNQDAQVALDKQLKKNVIFVSYNRQKGYLQFHPEALGGVEENSDACYTYNERSEGSLKLIIF